MKQFKRYFYTFFYENTFNDVGSRTLRLLCQEKELKWDHDRDQLSSIARNIKDREQFQPMQFVLIKTFLLLLVNRPAREKHQESKLTS